MVRTEPVRYSYLQQSNGVVLTVTAPCCTTLYIRTDNDQERQVPINPVGYPAGGSHRGAVIHGLIITDQCCTEWSSVVPLPTAVVNHAVRPSVVQLLSVVYRSTVVHRLAVIDETGRVSRLWVGVRTVSTRDYP